MDTDRELRWILCTPAQVAEAGPPSAAVHHSRDFPPKPHHPPLAGAAHPAAARQAAGARPAKRARPLNSEPRPPSSAWSVASPSRTQLALLVRQPWASLLVSGAKTWELRSSRTHKRGRVAIVASRTGGWIVGGATLVACHGPLSPAQLVAAEALHRVPPGATLGRYAETYAWEFADAAELAVPLSYNHPTGAVIWVALREAATV